MKVDVGIAFFMLGAFATLVKSEIHYPKGLYQSLVLFLMIAIGLKGGVALLEYASWQLMGQSFYIILMGCLLPLIAFPVLYYHGKLKRDDAASIAAHYGSVSVGTYAVAVAFLDAKQVMYEAYIPLFLVLLELPAIAVGIGLARYQSSRAVGDAGSVHTAGKALWHEVFFNQGMVLMVGGVVIGVLAGSRLDRVTAFFFDLFNGVLALFLLYMGMLAAQRLHDIRQMGPFMLVFGVSMPLLGGVIGALLGVQMGLSPGGVTLVAVLGGSASYIAVPAAMHVALPQANHSLSISAALGITFPFNVILGIPLYSMLAQWLTQSP